MTDDEKRTVEAAINFVKTILSQYVNVESANALYEISMGNKDIILDHLVAINKITGQAIEIIGGKEWKRN